MPRPMMPALITATVRTSVILSLFSLYSLLFARLLEMLNHALIARFGLADVFAQAGALLLGHRRDAGADAAQSGGNVVNVIHEADQFSSCGHEGSLRFLWRASGTGSSRHGQGHSSLFNMRADLAKEDNSWMLRD